MLRFEDCKPGVEIIAIKNNSAHGMSRQDLSIGMIYTIRSVTSNAYSYRTNKPVGLPAISVEETGRTSDGVWWFYTLDQFKLRNKEELIKLFDLNNIPQSLKDEVLEKC